MGGGEGGGGGWWWWWQGPPDGSGLQVEGSVLVLQVPSGWRSPTSGGMMWLGWRVSKEALKEAVILPIKFPHLFTGKS